MRSRILGGIRQALFPPVPHLLRHEATLPLVGERGARRGPLFHGDEVPARTHAATQTTVMYAPYMRRTTTLWDLLSSALALVAADKAPL